MLAKTTHGNIEVARGPIGAVFTIGGNVVATARICGRVWILNVPGHNWPVTADMATARFNAVPGDKITETCRKGFPSAAACVAEVNRILAN